MNFPVNMNECHRSIYSISMTATPAKKPTIFRSAGRASNKTVVRGIAASAVNVATGENGIVNGATNVPTV